MSKLSLDLDLIIKSGDAKINSLGGGTGDSFIVFFLVSPTVVMLSLLMLKGPMLCLSEVMLKPTE